MSLDDNKRVIRHFVDEVLNKKNIKACDQIAAENFVERVPFSGQGPGREGLKYAVTIFTSAFPDMQWTIDEQIAEGENVVTRFTWTGTHRGELMGIPATGKRVKVWGVVIDVVRDGIFAESRIIMDTVGMLQQLGVIPGV